MSTLWGMFLADPAVPIALAVVTAALAIPFELRSGEIPNTLTFGGIVAALVLTVVDRRFGLHALGFVMSALPAVALYRRELIGGGAVKLVTAVASFGGPLIAIGVWAVLVGVFSFGRLRRSEIEVASSPWVCLGTAAGALVWLGLGWGP